PPDGRAALARGGLGRHRHRAAGVRLAARRRRPRREAGRGGAYGRRLRGAAGLRQRRHAAARGGALPSTRATRAGSWQAGAGRGGHCGGGYERRRTRACRYGACRGGARRAADRPRDAGPRGRGGGRALPHRPGGRRAAPCGTAPGRGLRGPRAHGAAAPPRRTPDVSAVLFTSQVWPGVTFEALLSADTVASPGDYALTVGQVRVTALPAAQRDRVSASVEVTNLSTCLLLLDVRLRDDGAYVGDGWLLRVRARRAGQPPRPLVVTIPEVPLVTPLGVRTAANAFSAELSGRFVECERRTRPRAG